MLKVFRKLPEVFQRQIALQLVCGISMILVFLIILICSRNFYMSFPCLLLAVLLIADTGIKLYNCAVGNYLKTEGVCTAVNTTGFRKKIKSLDIRVGQDTLHLPIHKRIRQIKNGDTVIIYINKNDPVYERDGKYILYGSYALEVRGVKISEK